MIRLHRTFYLLAVFLLFVATDAAAQLSYYNSDTYWSNFSLRPHLRPGASDTCLVFVSNRHVYPDSLRFVDESVDTCSLKYLLLQKRGSQWRVYQAASLEEAMQLLPVKKDIVVYAEGMGKIFTTNVERALLMSSQYNVNVVMFDYASISTAYRPSRNFRFARSNARLSAKQYFTLLEQLQAARLQKAPWLEGVSVSLFYHSMGNIILRTMMQQQPVERLNSYPFVENLVINAACVPQKRHKEWVEQIRFARNIYIHYNKKDLQLKGAHFLTFRRQLGENVRKPFAANAVYVNFKKLVGWQHTYFLNFPKNEFRMPPPVKTYFSQLFLGNNAAGEAPVIFSGLSPGAVHQGTLQP